MENRKCSSKTIFKRVFCMALVSSLLICSCMVNFAVTASESSLTVSNNSVSEPVGTIKVNSSPYSPMFGQTVYLKPSTQYTFSYKYSTDKADDVILRYYKDEKSGTDFSKTGPVYDTYYNMVTYTFTTASLDAEGVITDEGGELIKSYVGIRSNWSSQGVSDPKYEMYDFIFGDFQLLENGNGENHLKDTQLTTIQTAVNDTNSVWGSMDRTTPIQIANNYYARYKIDGEYPTRDFFVSSPKDEAIKLKNIDATGPYLVQRVWLKPATTYVFSYYYSDAKASKFVYYNASSETNACSNVKESYDSVWKKVYYEFTTVGTDDAKATYNDDKSLVHSIVGIRCYNGFKTGSYFAGFDLYEANDPSQTNWLTDTKFTSVGQLNNGNKWASYWAGTWTNNYYARVKFDEELSNDVFRLANQISIGTITNGVVTASSTAVVDGQSVTLNVVPNDGYKLLELTVSGKPVPCINGEYSFTFSNYYSDPSTGGKVNVAATFVKENTVPALTNTAHSLDKAIAQDVWLEPDTDYNFSYIYSAEPASDIRAGYVKKSDSNSNVDLETSEIESEASGYNTKTYTFKTPKLTDENVTVGEGQNAGLVKCAVGLFFAADWSAQHQEGDCLFGELSCYKADDAYKTNLIINRDYTSLNHDNSGKWKSYYSKSVKTYMICVKYDADKDLDGKQDPSSELFKKILLGDCNGDNSVNIIDLVALKKYLANNDYTINRVGADVNQDGDITAPDLVALRRLLLAQ